MANIATENQKLSNEFKALPLDDQAGVPKMIKPTTWIFWVVGVGSFVVSLTTFEVPSKSRGPEAPREVWRFAGLDDVAPGLSEAFLDRDFRSALRTAGRRDLAKSANVKTTENLFGKNWTTKTRYEHLDEVLRPMGGDEFIRGLTSLTLGDDGRLVLGDWLDTTSPDVTFWHQDLSVQATSPNAIAIVLGFPPDDYDGSPVAGVFPNLVPLSHAFHDDFPAFILDHHDRPLGKDHILRPTFQRGNELLLYYDAFTFHRSPDRGRRKGIWRFM